MEYCLANASRSKAIWVLFVNLFFKGFYLLIIYFFIFIGSVYIILQPYDNISSEPFDLIIIHILELSIMSHIMNYKVQWLVSQYVLSLSSDQLPFGK